MPKAFEEELEDERGLQSQKRPHKILSIVPGREKALRKHRQDPSSILKESYLG